MKPEEAINQIEELMTIDNTALVYLPDFRDAFELAVKALKEETICPILSDDEVKQPCIKSPCGFERPHGEWIITGKEHGALGLVYKIKRCSNCGFEHSLLIPENFCPRCGADMRKKEGEAE